MSRHLESIAVMGMSAVLVALMLSYLGYDLRDFSRVYVASRNADTRFNAWTIEQAIDNLRFHRDDLGFANIFYGDSEPFAYTIAPYGIAVVTLPIYVISGQALIFTYNLYFVFTYIFTAWAMFLIVRYVTHAPFAVALPISLMVAFGQFRQVHLMHIETLSMAFPLLALYCLHRLFDEARIRWAIGLGLAFWLTLITSGNLGMAFVTIAAVLLFGLVWWHRDFLTRRRILLFALAGLLSLTLMWPFIRFRFANPVFAQGYPLGEILAYTGTPLGWLRGDSLVYQSLTGTRGEDTLFLGVTPIILAALGWRIRRKAGNTATDGVPVATFSAYQIIILYTVVIAVGYIFTLGPAIDLGNGTLIPLPYGLIVHLPGYSAIRVTARFILLVIFGTAILGAYGLTALLEQTPRLRHLLLAVVWIALFIELTPFPYAYDDNGSILSARLMSPAPSTFDRSAYQWLAQQPYPTPVFEYPADNRGLYDYVTAQSSHHQPILDGKGSYLPEWSRFTAPPYFPGEAGLNFLHERHIRYVLVHNELLPAIEQLWVHTFLQDHARFVNTFGNVEVWEL
jgi:hypothetical protein